jgi:hypothetical protein
MRERVNVILEKGSQEFDGFDFSFAYDPNALTARTPIKGTALFSPAPVGCGWEDFRFEQVIVNDSVWPKGMAVIRVTGEAAVTDSGAPSCFLPKLPAVLFTLEFLVTDNRTYEGQFIPLRFVWLDCTDNTIFLRDSDNVAISHRVFDPKREKVIVDSLNSYPTFAGVRGAGCASDSIGGGNPRMIDFIHGGVRITSNWLYPVGGDLNLNEIFYEFDDLTLYAQYFMFGDTVFRINRMGQLATSDVNQDGKTLTVMDLAYLARMIMGDAKPPPRYPLPPFPATLSRKGEILNVNRPIGAGLIHAFGEVTPTLLIPGANMLFHFDGTVTRILVWDLPLEANRRINGDFMKLSAPIVYTELATYEGYEIDVSYNCCSGLRGDVNGDGKFLPTLDDAEALVDFLSHTNSPFCEVEADVNGDGAINVSDITYLIDYLYTKGPAPVGCG